jgi:type IX secretion system PorP/SprF family membrane protein
MLAFSQDSYFSNIYPVRSYFNPALAASFRGQSQGVINYRRQWSSLGKDFPFQSYTFNITHKLLEEDADLFAVELRGLKDQAPGSSFVQNQVVIGVNYKKLLKDGYNNAQFLSIGFSGGIGQNKANWDGLWFGNQFDFENGAPNLDLSSGESINSLLGTVMYPELNLGLVYESFYPKMSINAGIAMAHINAPDISFAQGINIKYNRKITMHCSFNFRSKNNLILQFAPIYTKQGVFHEFGSKVGLTYAAEDEFDISFGVATVPRMVQNYEGLGVESISFQIFIEKQSYRFSVGYDATVSRLSEFNSGRGGFEFSFAYTIMSYNNKSSFALHHHVL